MSSRGTWRALLVSSIVALAVAGGATASGDEGRGIDPNQGDSLVKVTLAGKGEALQLQKQSEDLGIEFNDHYLRRNSDGTVTVTVFADEDELAALAEAGYELGTTIEGPDTWRERLADMTTDHSRGEQRGPAAQPAISSDPA
jgi:hypothetical protein